MALLAATACGGCDSPSEAPIELRDEVWCDLSAPPCLLGAQDEYGVPSSCSVLGESPVAASAPGGARLCFDSGVIAPQAACASLCSPGAGAYLNPAVFTAGTSCTASVNRDPAYHSNLNAQGYRAHACTGASNDESALLSTAGTYTVTLSGSGTASYGGTSEPVLIKAGRFNVAAPNVGCSALQTTCPTQVNQLELEFQDFSVGALSMAGLTVTSDGIFVTASGTFVPPQPSGHPDFLFTLPSNLTFDGIGTIHLNGVDTPGTTLGSSDETFVAILLDTGLITLQFSLQRTLDGQVFKLTGTVSSDSVIDAPPALNAPATVMVDAGAACSANVTLSAQATSPVGLPVRLDYVADDGLLGTGASVSASLTPGTHQVTIVATDALGATSRTAQVVTVTTEGACP